MATWPCHLRSRRIRCWPILVSRAITYNPKAWIKADCSARFAWTGFTNTVHWMAPTAAGVFIGFGVLCIFLPCFNYLVDAFLPL